MHLATVRDAAGRTTAAMREDHAWRALPAADLSALLRTSTLAPAVERAGDIVLDAAAVLPLPRPATVICCGPNYADHIRETVRDRPPYPTLFATYADSLLGPLDDIVLPAGLDLDWEAELAVVVGATIRGADAATARAAIAGYTVANNISARAWQNRTLQWFQGKAWAHCTPLGPVVVTPDEVDPKSRLPIVCRVTGEVVQHDTTSTLVFDVPALLSYISGFTVLRAGDVVLTGTPGGVGLTRTPVPRRRRPRRDRDRRDRDRDRRDRSAAQHGPPQQPTRLTRKPVTRRTPATRTSDENEEPAWNQT